MSFIITGARETNKFVNIQFGTEILLEQGKLPSFLFQYFPPQ